MMRLVNLMTVDGLEPIALGPHAEARLASVSVFVVTQVLFVLIFSAMLLLI